MFFVPGNTCPATPHRHTPRPHAHTHTHSRHALFLPGRGCRAVGSRFIEGVELAFIVPCPAHCGRLCAARLPPTQDKMLEDPDRLSELKTKFPTNYPRHLYCFEPPTGTSFRFAPRISGMARLKFRCPKISHVPCCMS